MDICQNVKSFNQGKKHKRSGVDETQVSRIIKRLAELSSTPQNTRLKTLLSLLIFQGLRQIEVVRLDVADINLEASDAMVRGKGKDDKEVIDLHPQTVKALKEYLLINHLADGPLFVSMSNNSKNQRITTKTVRNLVNKFLKEVGIEGKTTHGFRHYFTTALIKQFKGDLLEVSQYTRHHSLEMLQVYNDRVKKNTDLPKFYQAFNSVLS